MIYFETGERIFRQRRKLGMTQVGLAEKCGLSEAAIRSYERGTRVPKENHRKLLAKALGMDPETLRYSGPYDENAVVHMLMQMEDEGQLEPILIDGLAYVMPYNVNIEECIQEWGEKHRDYATGKISEGEYREWKDGYNSAGAIHRTERKTANQHFDSRKAKRNEDRMEELAKLPVESDREVWRKHCGQ